MTKVEEEGGAFPKVRDLGGVPQKLWMACFRPQPRYVYIFQQFDVAEIRREIRIQNRCSWRPKPPLMCQNVAAMPGVAGGASRGGVCFINERARSEFFRGLSKQSKFERPDPTRTITIF